MVWPELAGIGYISGRAATEDDVNSGVAVFVLKTGGIPVGKPIGIKIPQYAIHKDVDSGESTNVIIIQAESSQGNDIYGALVVATGGFMVGTAPEFTLLGQVTPK